MEPFPAIGNPDFLAVASDKFLYASIKTGRPGRRMPMWGDKTGGLRPAEMRSLVKYLRKMGEGRRPEPDERPARWVKADAGAGQRLYARTCAACHGDRGKGREGPALNNGAFLKIATDTYLVETIKRGRTGTPMNGYAKASVLYRSLSDDEIETIVAYIRTWEKKK
jgi:cytochrome c oxidase cbb3-type subunit 3